MTRPTDVHSERYSEQWSWASLTRQLELDDEYQPADYPRAVTDTLVEILDSLESWAVPLALAVGVSPVGKMHDSSTPSLMILSKELTDDIELPANWTEWAIGIEVERITGATTRTAIHEHMLSVEHAHNKTFHVDGIRAMACRYAIGPASTPEEFVLSSWRGTEFRTVRTTTADGKRWINEPQTENQVFLPVPIDIYGTDVNSTSLDLTMDPAWSYYGDKDEPGWQMIVETTERLLATSDDWEISLLKPGDPAKR